MKVKLLNMAFVIALSIIPFIGWADVDAVFTRNVNGGGTYTETFTKQGASTYIISATVSDNWIFVDPTGLFGPNGWRYISFSDTRSAIYDNSASNSLADIFSARIWGRVTKPSGGTSPGSELPAWCLQGKADVDFRIDPDSVFMWIENAGIFRSLQGSDAVPSYWQIIPLYGADGNSGAVGP